MVYTFIQYQKTFLTAIALQSQNVFAFCFLCFALVCLPKSGQAQQCSELLTDRQMTIRIDDCSAEAEICLSVFLENIASYDIAVNGVEYSKTLRACNYDTVIIYSYYALLGQGAAGPYRLSSWKVDDRSFSGQFRDAAALVDSMNRWNPTGHWLVNTATKNIVGGNSQNTYSSMVIEQLQLPGTFATLGFNEGLTALGTMISLPVGVNQVVLFERGRDCIDTLMVNVLCGTQLVNDTLQTKEKTPVVAKVLENDQNVEVETMNISQAPKNGVAQVNLDYSITYKPTDGFCGLDSFRYEICNASQQCFSAQAYVTVKCADILVHTGFSPNGDQYNEFFEVQGLQAYPNSSLMVFNVWGNLVYKSEGSYKNDWNGKWKGKDLPSGTYYYLIHLNDPSGTKYSGWLQIHR